jgi:hypothetical protein
MGSGGRWRKKPLADGRVALDTSDLKRLRLLVPGTANRPGVLTWSRGGERASQIAYRLTVGADAGTLRLVYSTTTDPPADLDYPVPLVATPCHLGGVRWWFLCPLARGGVACGRRVRKLYLGGRYFGCRRCHNLTYRSTQQSDARVYALARAGLHAMPRAGHRATVTQLGLALKALTLMEKRAKRWQV